jgi:cell division protein YceG involved in septum cleavage
MRNTQHNEQTGRCRNPKLHNMTKEQAKNKFMVQALANIPTEFNEDGTLKRKDQYIEIAKKMAKENIEKQMQEGVILPKQYDFYKQVIKEIEKIKPK